MTGSERSVFAVAGPVAHAVERVSLAKVGLWERRDLQEWIIEHPEVLGDGPEVLIVAVEFDRWSTDAGVTAHQRLDLLGIDTGGRLVVVELKRASEKTIHLQAITYAALVSRFDEDTLASVFAEHLTKRGKRALQNRLGIGSKTTCLAS